MSNPCEEGRASARARSSSSEHSDMAPPPIERLTDDLLLEILSRLPAKSVCRFKCASKNWLRLVDNPDHRRTLPHSLVGFFYNSESEEPFPISAPHFVNASGRGRPFICPSFAFLPDRRRLHLLDCCNGLILCCLYGISTTGDDEFRYVMCNPATEEWVVLPDRSQAGKECSWARLGFDPTASPHFHVFVFLLDARQFITGLDVYSSETRGWIHKEQQWDENVRLADPQSATVFFKGCLHLLTVCVQCRGFISVVDTKGETWSNFDTPGELFGGELYGCDAFLQQSHSQLHYASFHHDDEDGEDEDGEDEVQLQVFTLDNYTDKEWVEEHRVELKDVGVFGGIFEGEFNWMAIHPESSLIYFNEGSRKAFKCYSMDRQKKTELCTLGEGQPPYLPYVPLYSRLESLSM